MSLSAFAFAMFCLIYGFVVYMPSMDNSPSSILGSNILWGFTLLGFLLTCIAEGLWSRAKKKEASKSSK
jgi:hypothetical protein